MVRVCAFDAVEHNVINTANAKAIFMMDDLSINNGLYSAHKTANALGKAAIKHQRQFLYIAGKWRGSRKQPPRHYVQLNCLYY